MLIYFVRHGQTDWNKAQRWQGRSDIELNETGREQASSVKQWFVDQGVEPSAILSSPKKRARATADCIADALGLPVICDPAFMEVSLGHFEGKTTEELQQEYGKQFDDWLKAYHLEAPPGGESIQQAIERMYPALKKHLASYGDQLVIVAHQAILMAMKAALSGNLSLQALAAYKQANYEIDLWDINGAQIAQRVDIRTS